MIAMWLQRKSSSFLTHRLPVLRINRQTLTFQSAQTVTGTFPLTKDEENLFNVLKSFIASKNRNTTLRVAGGWVRDKILQLPGKNDVDIAIDNMTGLEFIEQFNQWNQAHGNATVKYGVVKKNPSKSKHLETGICLFSRINLQNS
jgi:hypothetical protein